MPVDLPPLVRPMSLLDEEEFASESETAPTRVPGRKDDNGKVRWDLLVWPFISDVANVLTHGARKYEAYNWMNVKDARPRYFSAAQRHLVAWYEGESRDPETGYHHLSHATCCLMFLWWFDE